MADSLRGKRIAIEGFCATGRPVAAICHGPWTLVEASVVGGKTFTSWPSLKTDLKNAGAKWVDKEVVTDVQFISSRKPDDIPAFSKTLIEALGKGGVEQGRSVARQKVRPVGAPFAFAVIRG